MSPRRSRAALTASPVLVGAVTVLVTIVAVFLSYNANTGLPFVPTYDLKANLPNASQLVKGFDVRIGGARVGQVAEITPKRRPDGTAYAQVTLKLDKEVEPLPADSTVLVRPRSALGLKYLEVRPGEGQAGFKPGATIPIRQATPEVVEIDDFFNMFDAKARVGSRNSLDGFGTGLAGRGRDLNTAIDELRPLLDDLEPVAKNLADPRTGIDRFFKALADTASEVAPAAEEQASLFVNLDTTFTALATIARPYLQESISEGPITEQVSINEFPKQRPFLRNNAAFFRELQPGVATLPHSAPILADAFQAGTENLPKTIPVNEELADTFDTLADFSEDPMVVAGRGAAHAAVLLAEPDAEVHHAGPDHLQLRDAVLPQRGERALRGRRERHVAAVHDHPDHGHPGHRAIRAQQQRDRPLERALRRPGQAQPHPLEPVPQHRLARSDQGVRGRERALRDRQDADRQPAGEPGHQDQQEVRVG